MKATLNQVGGRAHPETKTETTTARQEQRTVEGYEMLVGEGHDSEEARDEWIDEVENLLEFESLEKGQQHTRKNFNNPSTHNERKYFERK